MFASAELMSDKRAGIQRADSVDLSLYINYFIVYIMK